MFALCVCVCVCVSVACMCLSASWSSWRAILLAIICLAAMVGQASRSKEGNRLQKSTKEQTYCPQIAFHLLSISDSLYFFNGIPIRQAPKEYYKRLSAAKAVVRSMRCQCVLKPRQTSLNSQQTKLVDDPRWKRSIWSGRCVK